MATFNGFPYPFTCLFLAVAAALVSACSPPASPEVVSNTDISVGETVDVPPEDRDPNRLWCGEHGVYEDECIICHPELAHSGIAVEIGLIDPPDNSLNGPAIVQETAAGDRDPNRLWCGEHGVYEDECTICHPELAQTLGAKEGVLQCREHRVPEQECGICHPELLAALPTGKGLKVRFESMVSAEKAGVRTGYPTLASWTGSVSAPGEITYNKNQFAYITPLLGGVVRSVLADAGDRVEAGQLLAEISAPGLASERSDLAKATANRTLHRATVAREQKLVDEQISARQDLEEAQARLAEAEAERVMARQRLLDMGLSDVEINGNSSTTSVLPVRAPFAGTITDRDAVLGAAIEPGMPLFQLADLSTMWMDISIPEEQLPAARLGSALHAEFDPLPGIRFDGVLTWISTSVDETTRMLKGRGVFPNPDGQLRNAMFGRVALADGDPRATVVVPPQAIQFVDGRAVVFAKLERDLYETRLVRTGPERRGAVPILDGLSPEDEIVLGESYILKSELLKARLGAGCVDE